MRLKHITVRGFRAFPEKLSVNLDADVVVVAGRNGTGKTSLFDAIVWALSGSLPRLKDNRSVVSLYSETGSAEVKLMLEHEQQPLTVIRTTDGTNTSCRLIEGDQEYETETSKVRLLDLLWPGTEPLAARQDAMVTAMTRSVYLQQDLLKQFISSDTEADRFKVLSELLGAGRIVDLQQALEYARNMFSRHVVTDLQAQTAELTTKYQNISARLLTTKPASNEIDVQSAIDRWLKDVFQVAPSEVLEKFQSPIHTLEQLDAALKLVAEASLRLRRDRSELEIALGEVAAMQQIPDPASSLQERETALKSHESEIQTLKQALAAAQTAQFDARRLATKRFQSKREMQQLAALALKHLEEVCPVCSQHYDREATTRRLSEIAGTAPASEQDEQGALDEMLQQIANLERSATTLRMEIFRDKEAQRSRNDLLASLKRLFDRAKITTQWNPHRSNKRLRSAFAKSATRWPRYSA